MILDVQEPSFDIFHWINGKLLDKWMHVSFVFSCRRIRGCSYHEVIIFGGHHALPSLVIFCHFLATLIASLFSRHNWFHWLVVSQLMLLMSMILVWLCLHRGQTTDHVQKCAVILSSFVIFWLIPHPSPPVMKPFMSCPLILASLICELLSILADLIFCIKWA